MDCSDFTVFMFLLIVCFNVVFSQSRQDLNGPCRIVNECKPVGYYCAKNATCQCRSGYTPSEKWNKCLGYVGSRCIYDSQCIEGAYCTGPEKRESCRCREEEDYFPSEDGQTCTSAAVSVIYQKTTSMVFLTLLCSRFYLNT